jgi:hypothetical protein
MKMTSNNKMQKKNDTKQNGGSVPKRALNAFVCSKIDLTLSFANTSDDSDKDDDDGDDDDDDDDVRVECEGLVQPSLRRTLCQETRYPHTRSHGRELRP